MRVKFIPNYNVKNLSPADYNPRKLEEDKFIKLQESIKKYGVIKPLIINGDNGILTAGHQRTRAMKAVGVTHAPVIKIGGIKIQDEIKFNLFHNSIETSKSKVLIKNVPQKIGYYIVRPEDVTIVKNDNAMIVKAIGDLIMRYGEWGSIIADEDGNVIFNSDYAVAAKLLGKETICYVIKNKDRKNIIELLSIEYGEYNYDTLGIKSYNQLYCQLNRLTKNAKKMNKSSTYEQFVLPIIQKNDRLLDFGAGKCAYVEMLKQKGYKAFAYEPHYQNANNNIDIKKVVKQLYEIEKDVRKNGLYDIVVLDSVLNSVVNDEVENYVVAVCRAFLKPEGVFITGTRNLESVESKKRMKKNNTNKRCIEFLDKKNYSATFRNGVWTMQHFHTEESLKKLLDNYYDDVNIESTCASVYAICKNPKPIDSDYLSTALDFELNMEYPNGFHHNKHQRLKKLIQALVTNINY